MSGTLGQIIGQILVALLQWWAARVDLEDKVKGKIALEAAELAKKALQWKVDHPVDLDSPGTDDFRVQPGPKPERIRGKGSEPSDT
jgi:hypothetical protein